MADITDVLNVLTTQIAGIVYPNGTSQPSVSGAGIKVYPGWPVPSQIDADLAAGITNISIYPTPVEQNTTRYAPTQHVMSTVAPTLTLTLSSDRTQIAIGGTLPAPFSPCNLAVMIGTQAFVYPVQATDTLSSIAAGIATLITQGYPGTTSTGSLVTLPAGIWANAVRVGTSGQVAAEWERQQQQVQITVWAPDPTTRGVIGSAIKAALAQLSFLTMPDGFGARIRYQKNMLSDEQQLVRLYRRDLFYTVEYATTVTQTAAEVVAVNATTQAAPAATMDVQNGWSATISRSF